MTVIQQQQATQGPHGEDRMTQWLWILNITGDQDRDGVWHYITQITQNATVSFQNKHRMTPIYAQTRHIYMKPCSFPIQTYSEEHHTNWCDFFSNKFIMAKYNRFKFLLVYFMYRKEDWHFNNAIYQWFVSDGKELVSTILSTDGILKFYFLNTVSYSLEIHLGDTGWKFLSRSLLSGWHVSDLIDS